MSNPASDKTIEKFDVQAVNSRQSRELYEARKKIHPKRAKGTYRNLKWAIMLLTLSIYYLTPWLRWHRGEYAPDQAVLIDLASRRFYFFFIEIWPQEFFYVAGMLVMAGIGLFLVTSTIGRAWCGYTCPQTVWVDLFLLVERFFEGDRNERIRLDNASMSVSKLYKRTAKHVVWLVIAALTGGAWIFYFADAPTLIRQLFTGQASYAAYATVAILMATTYIFGGLMREQVCTYMCPWPRIQGAMLDENSLVVTYNAWRGEPRSRHAKKMKREGVSTGDCVDCNACVVVCPMGIDIREGQQMECITCALCIDACDGVMEKIGIDRGLISYSTFAEYKSNEALAATGKPALTNKERASVPQYSFADFKPENVRLPDGKLSDKVVHTTLSSFIRPRTLIYLAVYIALGLAMLVTLATRSMLYATVTPDRNPLYVKLSDGSIRNGYVVKIANKITEPKEFTLSLEGLDGANLKIEEGQAVAGKPDVFMVPPDQIRPIRVFVIVPHDKLQGAHTDFQFKVTGIGNQSEVATVTTSFEAPESGK